MRFYSNKAIFLWTVAKHCDSVLLLAFYEWLCALSLNNQDQIILAGAGWTSQGILFVWYHYNAHECALTSINILLINSSRHIASVMWTHWLVLGPFYIEKVKKNQIDFF